jgi:hypothetical protein
MRELFVPALQKSKHVQVPLMRALRYVPTTALYVVQDALAEPLESDLSQLAKHLPV